MGRWPTAVPHPRALFAFPDDGPDRIHFYSFSLVVALHLHCTALLSVVLTTHPPIFYHYIHAHRRTAAPTHALPRPPAHTAVHAPCPVITAARSGSVAATAVAAAAVVLLLLLLPVLDIALPAAIHRRRAHAPCP